MATYKEYDWDPRNLPQKLLAAIGLATASAAQTENLVEMTIAGCLGVDTEYGKAVTTHMAMPLRFSALRASAEIRIEDLDALDQLDNLLEVIEEAFEKRNGIVHHSWCCDPDTGEVFTVKETARTSVRSDLIPMSVNGVKADALFIYDAGMRLMSFMRDHGLLPKLPPLRSRAHKSKAARKKRREAKLRTSFS
jgi:hypothetical protein